MNDNKNSIFNYATKELSQDAVICWILNWVNYPDSELYELGCDLFRSISKEAETPKEIKIYQQKKSADIVVVIPVLKRIIIIEDKVYSTEHDNQIEKYKNEFEQLDVQKETLGITSEEPFKVSTVYLKTGFFYDADKLVVADCIIDGNKFYSIVSNPKYKGKSEILDDYVAFLGELISWYEKNGDISGRYDDGGYYLSWNAYSQHRLMRLIFPEDMWDGKSIAYRVYNGSSSGRPWTELDILEPCRFLNSEDKYELFWRIDSATYGPYISFRLYENFDKSNESKKERHRNYYSRLCEISKQAIENVKSPLDISWTDVKTGYSGNYKESAIFTIALKDYLEDWNAKKTLLAEYVRNITKEIVKVVENEQKNGLM